MTREEREMDLWTNVYTGYAAINGSVAQTEADHALKAFREAFPVDRCETVATIWMDMSPTDRHRTGLAPMTGYTWRDKHPADSYPGEDAP